MTGSDLIVARWKRVCLSIFMLFVSVNDIMPDFFSQLICRGGESHYGPTHFLVLINPTFFDDADLLIWIMLQQKWVTTRLRFNRRAMEESVSFYFHVVCFCSVMDSAFDLTSHYFDLEIQVPSKNLNA